MSPEIDFHTNIEYICCPSKCVEVVVARLEIEAMVKHSRMQQGSVIRAKRDRTSQLSLQPLEGRGKSGRL